MRPPALPPRYRIVGHLGAGGFGAVFRAEDQVLGREVAIKILGISQDPAVRARFEREARVLARIEHPHILRVYDFGISEEGPYLVTELLEGPDLRRSRPAEPLPVMLAIAEGLQALHEADLLHRDVKPSNIIVTPQGRAVLLDLGLATGAGMPELTGTGLVVGTPAYMAPELFEGRAAGRASDWFAWGMSLDQLYDGQRPAEVARVVRACLASDPRDRPSGLTAIRRLVEGEATLEEANAGLGGHAGAGGDRIGQWAPAPGETTLARAASRSRRAGILAGFAGMLGLGILLTRTGFRGGSMESGPPEPVPVVAVDTGPAALGPGFPARLEAEWESVLHLGVRIEGPRGEEDLGFGEAAERRGVAVLDRLPVHLSALRWLAEGGSRSRLATAEIEALEAQDRALGELDLPPAFGPFLDPDLDPSGAPGLPDPPAGDTGPPGALPAEARLTNLPSGALGPEGEPWTTLALRHLAAAAAERERVLRELPGLAGASPATLLAENPERPGESQMIRALADPSSRPRALGLSAKGREAARRYLMTARRALDAARSPHQARAAGTFRAGFETVSLFLLGPMVTASRDRLFAGPPDSAAAATFEAEVLKQMRILRGRSLQPEGPLEEDELASRQRAWQAASRSGEPGLAAENLVALVIRLDAAGKGDEVAALWKAHGKLAEGYRGLQRRALEKALGRLVASGGRDG